MASSNFFLIENLTLCFYKIVVEEMSPKAFLKISLKAKSEKLLLIIMKCKRYHEVT